MTLMLMLLLVVLLVVGFVIWGVTKGASKSPGEAGAAVGQMEAVTLADGREVIVVRQTGTNGMAIASFILGLLGITLLGLIFGFVALGQIRNNPGQGGRGMAIAGIVLSLLWIAVVVALVAAA